MRTYNWKPGKIEVPEQVIDESGEKVFEDDGMTPKMTMVEKDSPFEGIVIINVPKYTERLELMKKVGLGQGDNVKLDQVKYVQAALDRITKVELTRKDGTGQINNVEDLEYDVDGAKVIDTIASEVIKGFRLGESSKPM